MNKKTCRGQKNYALAAKFVTFVSSTEGQKIHRENGKIKLGSTGYCSWQPGFSYSFGKSLWKTSYRLTCRPFSLRYSFTCRIPKMR